MKSALTAITTSPQCGKLTVELRESTGELLTPGFMGRALKLAAQLGMGKPERFCPPCLLRIPSGEKMTRTRRALFLPLVHPLLNSRLGVDKAFTGISDHQHLSDLYDLRA